MPNEIRNENLDGSEYHLSNLLVGRSSQRRPRLAPSRGTTAFARQSNTTHVQDNWLTKL
jgi:hypothetical protein